MATAQDPHLQRAFALLEKFPLIDGHNDLPMRIRLDKAAKGDPRLFDMARLHPEGDTDLPRLRAGRVSAQVFACSPPKRRGQFAVMTLEMIDIIHRMIEAWPQDFVLATEAETILTAKAEGRIASIIAVEGGLGLENSLAPLRAWHALGARLMTLCHNDGLDWVDSATDAPRHGGLTAFGRAVVAELNRLGMIVDLAHVAPSVMHQVLDLSAAPVLFSHSNALALCDHPRNVPDDVLDRLRAKDAVVMATFIPAFLNQPSRDWLKQLEDPWGKAPENQPVTAAYIAAHEAVAGPWPVGDMTDLVAHIEYIAQRVGVAHVGIGCDFYPGPMPDGLKDAACYPHILAALLRNGWSDDAIAAIACGNFLRLFRQVEAVGAGLRRTQGPIIGRVEDLDA